MIVLWIVYGIAVLINIVYCGCAGLLYDREWMIQSSTGDVLTQKKLNSLCSIQTFIDLTTGIMHVRAPSMQRELAISLQSKPKCTTSNGVMFCGNRFSSHLVSSASLINFVPFCDQVK